MSEPEPKKDCGCGKTASELADKICLKVDTLAGSEAAQLCVVLSKDLKEGKISVAQWAAKMSTELKAKNVSPAALEKAFTEAVSDLRRTP